MGSTPRMLTDPAEVAAFKAVNVSIAPVLTRWLAERGCTLADGLAAVAGDTTSPAYRHLSPPVAPPVLVKQHVSD